MILNLQHACTKDKYRPAFDYVLITPEKCYATDSHIAVVAPTSEMFEAEFVEAIQGRLLIPSNVWAAMAHKNTEALIFDGKQIGIKSKIGGITYHGLMTEDEVAKFPNVDNVFWPMKDRKAVEQIGLDPDILARLGKALSYSGQKFQHLKLEFSGERRGVRVQSALELSNAYGMIVPVML